MTNIDEWAHAQSDRPNRSEAIRRLVEIGLAANVGPLSSSERLTAIRAQELASCAIEKVSGGDFDRNAKRAFAKDPAEFREVRRDRQRKTKTR